MTKRVLILPLNNLKTNKDLTMLCVRPFSIASAYTQNLYMYTSVTDETLDKGLDALCDFRWLFYRNE